MRYKILCLTLFFIATILCVNGQEHAPGLKWQRPFGGTQVDFIEYVDTTSVLRQHSTLVDRDGGFLVSGQARSNDGDVSGNHGLTDVWIAKLDTAKNILWKVSLGGTGVETIGSLILAPDSGYIFTGSASSHDGDVTGVHGNSSDIWVVRLGSKGNIIWQKTYGGSLGDDGISIATVGDDGYILAANVYGVDGDVAGGFGNPNFSTDIWVARLNKTGDIIWKKLIGGTGTDYPGTVKLTPDGGFIVTGSTYSTSIPGFHPGGPYDKDALVTKLDKDGNLVWQKCYGGSKDESAGDIEQIPDGNYIISATANSMDGDVTGYSGALYTFDTWILKISPTGTILGQKLLGGNAGEALSDIMVMPDNTFIGAGFTGSVNGDVAFNHGYYDFWVIKFDMNGKIWEKTFGGSGLDAAYSIGITRSGTFVVFGSTPSNDQDVSGNHGSEDLWLIEIGNTNTITGYTFLDVNGDGIKNNGEPAFDGAMITTKKGNDSLSAISHNGVFRIDVDTGTYTTKVLLPQPYQNATPVSKSSTFNSYSNTDSISFAIQPIPTIRNVRISMISGNGIRPGTQVQYIITYFNAGTDIVSGSIKLLKDPRLNFVSTNPAQVSLSGDTISWNFNNLNPNQQNLITVNLISKNPPQLNVSDIVRSVAWIVHDKPDLTPYDDTAVLKETVRGAIDPNDKNENNGGVVTPAHISGGKYLNYLIRFQNTGTDTAFAVAIRDTLDARLDWSSLQMTGASHNYSLQIKDGNKLTWTFPDIKLPDSGVNQTASHGYVAYRIRTKNTVAVGDTIKNTAAIYFDLNLPVLTNKHQTVVKNSIIAAPVLTGLQTNYCNTQGIQKVKINNIPVGGGMIVSAIVDATLLPVAADSTFSIDVSSLAAATHSVTVSFSDGTETQTALSNITIAAAVTPDVNVTANITNVTNLTLPVTVTATNAAGGGTTPLYTFAKDRTFTNILQAEGATNTLAITPSNLLVGDNWIYVRMKTSATCYTAQLNTDSINIKRDQTTGIIDLDNPTQPVSVFPNPFKKGIFISGLNAAKTYQVSVYNLYGQVIYTQRIAGLSETEIMVPGRVTGIYWLNIYDEKRKRSMGSAKLIRD